MALPKLISEFQEVKLFDELDPGVDTTAKLSKVFDFAQAQGAVLFVLVQEAQGSGSIVTTTLEASNHLKTKAGDTVNFTKIVDFTVKSANTFQVETKVVDFGAMSESARYVRARNVVSGANATGKISLYAFALPKYTGFEFPEITLL